MPTREELKEMAISRLNEAKILCDNNCYDGACYLAGYVIELALKARICKLLDINDYIDSGDISLSFKTHKLDNLLKLAGLENKFDNAKLKNLNLDINWSIVTKWTEQFRYNPIGTNKEKNTKEIIEALENKKNGVFSWLKKKW